MEFARLQNHKKKIFLVTFLENLADQPLNRITSILDYSLLYKWIIHNMVINHIFKSKR